MLTEKSNEGGNSLEKNVSGKNIKVKNVEKNILKEIEDYFIEKSFLMDQYNLAVGTFISKTSYKIGSLVCLIISTAVGYNPQDTEFNPNPQSNIDIKIECSDILE